MPYKDYDHQKEYEKKRYYEKIASGVCPNDGRPLIVKNGKILSSCEACLEKARQKATIYRKQHVFTPVSDKIIHNADLVDKIFNHWKVVELLGVVYHPNGNSSRQWQVQCTNCGNTTTKYTSKLKSKRICKHCLLKPKSEPGFNRLFKLYKRVADKYGRQFTLGVEQFREMTSSNCFYCGHPPRKFMGCHVNVKSKWGDYTYNGIDRKNSDKGYIPENCLPCCYICNRAKNDMPFDEFISYLRQVSNYPRT